jgi:carboxymethylenebutenolidase
MIDIKTPDGTSDSYISYPDKGGSSPAVLFFMDAIGLRPVLKQMADRVAADGFYVLVPNMFYRSGRAPVMDPAACLKPENAPTLFKMIGSLTPDLVARDAGGFLDFLAKQKEVKPGSKVGLTGYCMGGTLVMRAAAAFPDRIAAGACFHAGGLVSDDPHSPHRLVEKIKARLYFAHADNDSFNTQEQISQLEKTLKAANAMYQSELYKGALHGFTMTDLPVYNKEACDKHWQKMMSLFKETLAA